jgi:hypothetical protein
VVAKLAQLRLFGASTAGDQPRPSGGGPLKTMRSIAQVRGCTSADRRNDDSSAALARVLHNCFRPWRVPFAAGPLQPPLAGAENITSKPVVCAQSERSYRARAYSQSLGA